MNWKIDRCSCSTSLVSAGISPLELMQMMPKRWRKRRPTQLPFSKFHFKVNSEFPTRPINTSHLALTKATFSMICIHHHYHQVGGEISTLSARLQSYLINFANMADLLNKNGSYHFRNVIFISIYFDISYIHHFYFCSLAYNNKTNNAMIF